MPGALVSNIPNISSTIAPWYNTGEIITATVSSSTISTTIPRMLIVPTSTDTNVIFYNTANATQLVTIGSNGIYTTAFGTGTTGSIYLNNSISTTGSGIWCNVLQNPIDDETYTRHLEIKRKISERNRSAAVHRARGSIKRALKLMDNVGFGNDIRIFLSGDEIEVSHPDSLFKFVISKGSHDLINRTISPSHSTPYNLTLYTKTNIYVAKLCVVVKDTPVLDNVLAIAMFIKSGDEEHILKMANWYSLTDDEDVVLELALLDPLVERKLKLERFN